MGEVIELRNRSQRIEEACHWLARVDRGLTQSESQALTRWLAFDRRNEAALRHACGVWDRLDALGRLGQAFPQQAREYGESVGAPESERSVWRQRLSGAASIALVVLACMAGAWVASRDAPPAASAPAPHGH